MEPTFENISKKIAAFLVVPIDEVTPPAYFVDDLGADSLDLVEMIMMMEEEFEVEISDADAEKIFTVQDSVSFISKQLI